MEKEKLVLAFVFSIALWVIYGCLGFETAVFTGMCMIFIEIAYLEERKK